MSGRSWTDSERSLLADLYPVMDGQEIARRLNRSVRSIYQRAVIDGLRCFFRIKVDDKFLRRVRRLNEQGLADTEIARKLGCDRHVVSRRRRAMGLPSNQYGERFRARVAEKTREQCQRAGVASLGEYRALVYRVRAIKAGWPSDLRWRSVQILDALAAHGPMTRRQIAEKIGAPWLGSRKTLKSNDPEGSYLANLVARGLVVRLGRLVRGAGRGGSVNLYSIAIDAERSQVS